MIHIVDASGGTDAEGNPCGPGKYDSLNDVDFLEKEINFWLLEIIKKSWETVARRCEVEGKKIEKMLGEKLTGLGIKEEHIFNAIRTLNLDSNKPSNWTEDQLLALSDYSRKESKPMLIAFNKCDIASDENIKKAEMIRKKGYFVIPTSAESELALTNASKKGLIEYKPGSSTFNILNEKQLQGLDYIKTHVLDKFGSTGVQKCIEQSVKMLDLIVVYPVEDEAHLTDKEGRILPDAHFMKNGSTAKDLAYKVHTDLGDHFIRAVDARTHRIIGADYKLKDNDVIRIVADA